MKFDCPEFETFTSSEGLDGFLELSEHFWVFFFVFVHYVNRDLRKVVELMSGLNETSECKVPSTFPDISI